MEKILENASVVRVQSYLAKAGIDRQIVALSDSARTAAEAAEALGIEVGQVASSIVFKLPNESALLVITSGRHRVDTKLVATAIGVEKLHRADAGFVRDVSGFAIGGVSPVGWINPPGLILIDEALNDYEVVWAAAGHPHSVYSTTYLELTNCTGAKPMVVGD
ncbi:MAG: YbaK/EbsC family protein [Candidatus Nanopelagicaceae bacterium]|nr:YbaK/EbsC family protein [Candidatus Nanopelagicaceae bacterium]